jgi:hypothetical protein
MLVSTLRKYVAALGGKVRVVVELELQPATELKKRGAVPRAAAKKRAGKAGKLLETGSEYFERPLPT